MGNRGISGPCLGAPTGPGRGHGTRPPQSHGPRGNRDPGRDLETPTIDGELDLTRSRDGSVAVEIEKGHRRSYGVSSAGHARQEDEHLASGAGDHLEGRAVVDELTNPVGDFHRTALQLDHSDSETVQVEYKIRASFMTAPSGKSRG